MVSVASKPESVVGQAGNATTKQSVFNMPVHELVGWLAVCGCSFLNLANVLVDKEEVGLDVQVLAKLGLIGIGGLYGFHGALTRPNTRRILFSFPVVWILLILGFYIAAIPFSTSPRHSLVSTCSIIGVLLMTVTALDHLGVMRTVKSIFAGMSFFIIGSWIFYFVFPEIGILEEAIPGGQFVYRMSGLAHANTLCQYAGLTVVLSVILFCSYKQRSMFMLGIGILALAALVNSYSRTSLMATMLALFVGYRHIYFRKELFKRYILLATILLLGLLVTSTQVDLGEKIASKMQLLSKSDDTEELTTATGRAAIWAHAIHLLEDRPLNGYGAATQKYHFEDHSLYTHNLFFNIAFSAGYIAGIAALLMIFGRLIALFYNRHPLSDSIVIFIVVNGLFENVIFSILAGLPTILWILALAWPLLPDDPAVKELDRSDRREVHGRFLRLGS